ncbi:GNAT family N-acetyltransferase [Streptomyces sp. NBC_01716]|uniref:GNAT family N-acetyltransferase n=1 Tax=Streptomyces sp. NBC_01716 TaxID=2975917 RepID=UPI002E3810D3|nr:GNAT family N-acetyltransferase [Streptomyces sp. NBC_01716]
MEMKSPQVRLEPWAEEDLGLLRAANAPELMEHLGGPETEEQLLTRHWRYVTLSADRTGKGRMFRIVLLPDGEAVGNTGFWESTWQGQDVYETGWSVLGGFQGRGLAVAGTRAVVERARAEHKHRFLMAFPSVGNGASNAVCRKVGFELLGESDFEYPVGHTMRCNEWRLDLETD